MADHAIVQQVWQQQQAWKAQLFDQAVQIFIVLSLGCLFRPKQAGTGNPGSRFFLDNTDITSAAARRPVPFYEMEEISGSPIWCANLSGLHAVHNCATAICVCQHLHRWRLLWCESQLCAALLRSTCSNADAVQIGQPSHQPAVVILNPGHATGHRLEPRCALPSLLSTHCFFCFCFWCSCEIYFDGLIDCCCCCVPA
eukprot:SAG11_NODE_447_length_9395_cov_4.121665_7_plen_198_part_00